MGSPSSEELAARLRATAEDAAIPATARPSFEIDEQTGKGTLTLPPTTGEPDPEGALRELGYDPSLYIFTPTRMKRWTATVSGRVADWLTSATFDIERRTEVGMRLPLLRQAARERHRLLKPGTADRTLVVALADMQVGKVDHRGGTPELLDRIESARSQLAAHLKARKPQRIILADLGDGIENFESGGNPMFTNDLSLPEQLDLYATIVLDWARTCAARADTTVTVVPSNHSAWRNGKQYLGKPSDDFGLLTHRNVERVGVKRAAWVYPNTWEQHVILPVHDSSIAFWHGSQANPGQALAWWLGQSHAGNGMNQAEVLVSAHYHTPAFATSGRTDAGRQKVWLQAPTLDNGSTHYANRAGGDSDPALMVFEMTPTGFDMGSLQLIVPERPATSNG